MAQISTDAKINIVGIIIIPIVLSLWAAFGKAHRAEIATAEARGRQAEQARNNKDAGIRLHKQVVDLTRIVSELRDAMIRLGHLDTIAVERTRSRPPIPPIDEDTPTPDPRGEG